MTLSLFGVTVNDAHMMQLEVADTEMIAVRDLAAICASGDAHRGQPDDAVVDRFSSVIGAFSNAGPVLPAPIGVSFRSSDAVKRWLELHYGALTEALTYVENRVAARVHIYRPPDVPDREVPVDIGAIAAECIRALRRSAVATLPLRADKSLGIVSTAAFLVERDLWKAFTLEVEAQQQLAINVRLELTGPWPPYDFVQMQLGA